MRHFSFAFLSASNVFLFQDHIYKLMKSDSYPRFLRSSAYQDLLLARKKVSLNLKCLLWQFLPCVIWIRFSAFLFSFLSKISASQKNIHRKTVIFSYNIQMFPLIQKPNTVCNNKKTPLKVYTPVKSIQKIIFLI